MVGPPEGKRPPEWRSMAPRGKEGSLSQGDTSPGARGPLFSVFQVLYALQSLVR